MKKLLYLASVLLSTIYMVLFCLNVSDMVSRHMDDEVFYPLLVVIFSILLSVVMLIINKFKPFDKKLFFIPLLFFTCSVITLIIGYYTPCPHCTL